MKINATLVKVAILLWAGKLHLHQNPLKTMKNLLFLLSMLLFVSLAFTSCKKEEVTPPPTTQNPPPATSRTYTTVSTFVGSTTAVSGTTDATGTAARFRGTGGMVQDPQGNLYVTDVANHTIRKVTPAGVVTTFAGTAGVSGSDNGTGTAAKFFNPYDLAIDASGNLYVVEYNGRRIRKITSAGVVTTVAGNGQSGSNNGTGTSATFDEPYSLVLDNAGNLFVGEYRTKRIRKIVLATSEVTTLAGGGTQVNPPFDGQGTSAKFDAVGGMCIDAQNNLYVADNSFIRKVTPTGNVTTIAGSLQTAGFVNGTGATARFGQAFGICRDAAGVLYVADRRYGSIRKITPEGVVSDFAGTTASMFVGGANPDVDGDTDGGLTTASFRRLSHLYINPQGVIFVGEDGGHRVRKIE